MEGASVRLSSGEVEYEHECEWWKRRWKGNGIKNRVEEQGVGGGAGGGRGGGGDEAQLQLPTSATKLESAGAMED